jgi:hypothetical protein
VIEFRFQTLGTYIGMQSIAMAMEYFPINYRQEATNRSSTRFHRPWESIYPFRESHNVLHFQGPCDYARVYIIV